MARAKKEIEKEIADVVKTLPVRKQVQVLDFAKRMVVPEKARQKEQGKGASFIKRLATEGLYDGDGVPYDIDQVVYEDML